MSEAGDPFHRARFSFGKENLQERKSLLVALVHGLYMRAFRIIKHSNKNNFEIQI